MLDVSSSKLPLYRIATPSTSFARNEPSRDRRYNPKGMDNSISKGAGGHLDVVTDGGMSPCGPSRTCRSGQSAAARSGSWLLFRRCQTVILNPTIALLRRLTKPLQRSRRR